MEMYARERCQTNESVTFFSYIHKSEIYWSFARSCTKKKILYFVQHKFSISFLFFFRFSFSSFVRHLRFASFSVALLLTRNAEPTRGACSMLWLVCQLQCKLCLPCRGMAHRLASTVSCQNSCKTSLNMLFIYARIHTIMLLVKSSLNILWTIVFLLHI